MKTFPEVFPPMFVSMVMSGEESGKLGDALNVVASQMEKTYLLQKKIKGALMYPSVIIVAMLGIAVFMLIYIVPTLTKTFKEIGTELPASTQFIIWMSDTFQAHMILVLISILSLVVLLVVTSRTKGGKRFFDFTFLHIPVISELIKESNSARTTRTLSSLLTSGVSVVEALNITKDVLQNSYYKEIIEKAKRNVETGAPMSEIFANAEKLYPVFVGEMIAVGEETGDLGGTLLKVAVFYEEEVEQKTKDMSTIIEPFLMLFVGIAVGFFAISMISPIYSVVDKI
jgi:type IV pilus assembly protein PilC